MAEKKPVAKKTAAKKTAEKKTETKVEAPTPVEPKPVTVAPADQSVPNTSRMTIGGHEYEVSEDRGRRRV